MILACVFLCINHGHLFWFTASKDSKEESGLLNLEGLSGFIPLLRNHPKKKSITWSKFIEISTLKLGKIFLISRIDILLASLLVELLWLTLYHFRNIKIPFLKSFRNLPILNSNLLSEIHLRLISHLKCLASRLCIRCPKNFFTELKISLKPLNMHGGHQKNLKINQQSVDLIYILRNTPNGQELKSSITWNRIK